MNTIMMIFFILGLLLILVYVALVYFRPSTKKERKKSVTSVKTSPKATVTLDALHQSIKDPKATVNMLEGYIEVLIKSYGKIHPKMGDLAHPDFKQYADIMMTLSAHKVANKDLIMKLDRGLRTKNPKYAQELDDALERGLTMRKFK